MLTDAEKMLALMSNMQMGDVRDAYITRARIESGRLAEKRDWLLGNGFVPVAAADGESLTSDGRLIFFVRGEAFALAPELHAQRLKAVMDDARDATQPETASEALGSSCPKCGEATNQTQVCPRCAMGKAGLRYQYACACGVTFFTTDPL